MKNNRSFFRQVLALCVLFLGALPRSQAEGVDSAAPKPTLFPASVLKILQDDLVKSNLEGFVPVETDLFIERLNALKSQGEASGDRIAPIHSSTLTAFWNGESLVSNLSFLDVAIDSSKSEISSVELPLMQFAIQPPRINESTLFDANQFSAPPLQLADSIKVPIDKNGRYWFAWSLNSKTLSIGGERSIAFQWPKSTIAELIIALPQRSSLIGEHCLVEPILNCPDYVRTEWFGEATKDNPNWYRIIRSSKSTSLFRIRYDDDSGFLQPPVHIDTAEFDFRLTSRTGELSCWFTAEEFSNPRLPELRVDSDLAVSSVKLNDELVEWTRLGNRLQIRPMQVGRTSIQSIRLDAKFPLSASESDTRGIQLPMVAVASSFVVNGNTQVTISDDSVWLLTDPQDSQIINQIDSEIDFYRRDWRDRSGQIYARHLSQFDQKKRIEQLTEYRIEQDKITQRIFVVSDKTVSDSLVLELTDGWQVETVQSSSYANVEFVTEQFDEKKQLCFFGATNGEQNVSTTNSQGRNLRYVVVCSRSANFQGDKNQRIRIGDCRIVNAETMDSFVAIDSTTGVSLVVNNELIRARRSYSDLSIDLESIAGDLTSRYIHDEKDISSRYVEFRFQPPKFDTAVTTQIKGRQTDLEIRHLVEIKPNGQQIDQASLVCSGAGASQVEWYYWSDQRWAPTGALSNSNRANGTVSYTVNLNHDLRQSVVDRYVLMGLSHVAGVEFDAPRIELPASEKQDFVLVLDESVGLIDDQNSSLQQLLCFENPVRNFGLRQPINAKNYKMGFPGLQNFKITSRPADRFAQPFFKNCATQVELSELGRGKHTIHGSLLGCENDTSLLVKLPPGFTFESFRSPAKIDHSFDEVNRIVMLHSFRGTSSDIVDFEIVLRDNGKRLLQSKYNLVFPSFSIPPVQHVASVVLPRSQLFAGQPDSYVTAMESSVAEIIATLATPMGLSFVTNRIRTYVLDAEQSPTLTISVRSTNGEILSAWLAVLIGGFVGLTFRRVAVKRWILAVILVYALVVLMPPKFLVLTFLATLVAAFSYACRSLMIAVRNRLFQLNELGSQTVGSGASLLVLLGISLYPINRANGEEIESQSDSKRQLEKQPLVILPVDPEGQPAGDVVYMPLVDWELLSANGSDSAKNECFITKAEHRINLPAITVFGGSDEFVSEYTINASSDESILRVPFDSRALSLPSIRLDDVAIANSTRVQIGLDEIKVKPGAGEHKLMLRFLLNGYRGTAPKVSIQLKVPPVVSADCILRLSADRAADVKITSQGSVAKTTNGTIMAELGALAEVDVRWAVPSPDNTNLDGAVSNVDIETYLALDELAPLAVSVVKLNGNAAKKKKLEFDCSSDWRPIGGNWYGGRLVSVSETDSLTRSRYAVELEQTENETATIRVLWAPANRNAGLLSLPKISLIGNQPNSESLFFASSETPSWELDGAVDWSVRDAPITWPPELPSTWVNLLAFSVPDQPSPALLRKQVVADSNVFSGNITGLVTATGIESKLMIRSESDRSQSGFLAQDNFVSLPPGSRLRSVTVGGRRISMRELDQLRGDDNDPTSLKLDIGKLLAALGGSATVLYDQPWPDNTKATEIEWQLPSFSNVSEMGVSALLFHDTNLFAEWNSAVSDFTVSNESSNDRSETVSSSLASQLWTAKLMLTDVQLNEHTTLGTIKVVEQPVDQLQLRLMNVSGQWTYECYADFHEEKVGQFTLILDISDEHFDLLDTNASVSSYSVSSYDVGDGQKRIQLEFADLQAKQNRLFRLDLRQITGANGEIELPKISFGNVPLDRIRVIAPNRQNGAPLNWILSGLVALDSNLTFFLPQTENFTSYKVTNDNYSLRLQEKRLSNAMAKVSSVLHRKLSADKRSLVHSRILTRVSENSDIRLSGFTDEMEIVKVVANGLSVDWMRSKQQLQTRVPYVDVPCVLDVYWESRAMPQVLPYVDKLETSRVFIDSDLSLRNIRPYTRNVLASSIFNLLNENESLFLSCPNNVKTLWLNQWAVVWLELDDFGELSAALRTVNADSASSLQDRDFAALAKTMVTLFGQEQCELFLDRLQGSIQTNSENNLASYPIWNRQRQATGDFKHNYWARLITAASLLGLAAVWFYASKSSMKQTRPKAA